MEDKIIEALGLMDAMDDEQWTSDGAPKVEAVASLGDFENLKRADIINAAPKFSRSNFDVSKDIVEEQPSVEDEETSVLNDMGYDHPEIVQAQEEFDEIVSAEANFKAEKKKRSDALAEVTARLMHQKVDPQTNQREIMRTIASSNAARAGRVANFQKNRSLLLDQHPVSPLDQSKSGEKKVRPLMGK
jgi:hypothetical protein